MSPRPHMHTMTATLLLLLTIAGGYAVAAAPTNSVWIVANTPDQDQDLTTGVFEKKNIPYPSDPLAEGEVLFHLDFATIDASNRIWVSKNFKETAKAEGLEFFLPFAKEDTNPMMTYAAVMTVVKSNDKGFAEGDVCVAMTIIQEYVVLKPAEVPFGVNKVDPQEGMPNSWFLGPFGFTSGLTAWTSVKGIQTRFLPGGETKDLQPGDKVYVSAGTGAVGLMATQIYKSMGADVIASTGSDEKVKFLKEELGIEAFNYKTNDIYESLVKFAPDGLQYYYDNVGGQTLDAAIAAMGHSGLIIACGQVSQYGKSSDYGITNTMQFVGKSLTMRGFLAPEFVHKFPEALADIGSLLTEGKLKWKETRFAWEDFPKSLHSLLTGDKLGKTILVGGPIAGKDEL